MNLAAIPTSRDETSLFLKHKVTPGKSFSSLSPSLHTNVNLKVTQKLLPSFQSLRIKKIVPETTQATLAASAHRMQGPKKTT